MSQQPKRHLKKEKNLSVRTVDANAEKTKNGTVDAKAEKTKSGGSMPKKT